MNIIASNSRAARLAADALNAIAEAVAALSALPWIIRACREEEHDRELFDADGGVK